MSVYRCDKKKHQKQKKKNVPMVRPNCTTFILIEKYRAPVKISMKTVKQTVNNFFFSEMVHKKKKLVQGTPKVHLTMWFDSHSSITLIYKRFVYEKHKLLNTIDVGKPKFPAFLLYAKFWKIV